MGVLTKYQNLRVEINYVSQIFDLEVANFAKKKSKHDHKSSELFAKLISLKKMIKSF